MKSVKKKYILFFITIFQVFLSISINAQENVMPILKTAWKHQYPILMNIQPTAKGIVLYNMQVSTNNLLVGAYNAKEYGILDSLAEVYLNLGKGLDTIKKGSFHAVYLGGKLDSFLLEETYILWLDTILRPHFDTSAYNPEEGILNSSQFCYLLSKSLHLFVQIPNFEDYPNINRFIQFYSPVILSHYERWIYKEQFFQTQAWGGVKGRYNHFDFLQLKIKHKLGKTPKYCNAILDSDLWIICGLTEFLAAYEKNKSLVFITDSINSKFKSYLSLSCDLIESRLTRTQVEDFHGNKISGLNFDINVWRKHPDNNYSKYDGLDFPNDKTKNKTVKKIGWDIGHAARFVHVFETLYVNKNITNSSFPSEIQMQQISNQFIYGVFNKNIENPLFANYMSGDNGWYRVNYSNRMGFGYAPGDLSFSVITGGFCFWGKYNSDIYTLRNALWKIITSSDPDIISFREKSYGTFYNNYERTKPTNFKPNNSIGAGNLIMFLPTFL